MGGIITSCKHPIGGRRVEEGVRGGHHNIMQAPYRGEADGRGRGGGGLS